ncbi:MAG: hypothetical protein JWM08_1154 [Candidatus Angelobacter sp.]|nr:hypothetical protein [Candidatus Angelobacter sp.]
MYTLVMNLRTVTLDSEYLKKVRSPKGINFLCEGSCKKYTFPVYLNENEGNNIRWWSFSQTCYGGISS